ncbi:cell division protein FtsA [Mesorhizobium sp. CGMCC 1.15528]|uniref:Cell division protein FtsA n=1 Tax=Mesorhizobium zhangyense TaxID=1776730 RepID=A0A7C9VCA5_9HYPH|nr:cell division protein FtsA [Mesorhizobium zhangyense]NGN40988.1 cell division protein FtsA [Mesorhizobium zhangyense]
MSLLGGPKDGSAHRSGIVTVLDVGSSKVCCVVAKLKPAPESQLLRGRTHQAKVIGIGHQKSQGVKSGVVVDLDRAEHAVRLAVDAAERMAGLTVDSLIVNLTAGRLKSETFSATINLGGHEASAGDIKRVLAAGAKQALKAEREVVHSLPVAFSLDAERGVRDPRGMVGDTLGVDMHVLTGDSAPLRNLELCINRSHLSVERMVATPYASGLAALVDDELEMGAACIDMGGGTTTISLFADGKFVYADAIPVGGSHVTMDMAKGLSTRLDDAERLKVMHGSALPGSADDRDLVTVQPIGADDTEVPLQVPRSVMTRIIRARIEETLEILRDRLNKSGYGNAAGKRVVLTGGASQLAGLPEAARRILGRNVRIGRPLGVAGLPEAAKGPAFATAVGLLIYPQVAGFEINKTSGISGLRMTGTGGKLHRMSQWLRDSF